mgnify:CR=1 FL=1
MSNVQCPMSNVQCPMSNRSEPYRVGYQKKRVEKLGENPPAPFKGFSGPV